jgi:hypothetical protein
MTKYLDTRLCIDPSGRGGDETAYCVASFVNGYIVIHELDGLPGGYDDVTLSRIAKIANQYQVSTIMVEANYGDGMFTSLLRPIVYSICGRLAIEEFKVSGSKEKRIIDTLEPIMSQHRLIFDTEAIRSKETQIQISRMQDRRGALKHDDRIDVLSSIVKLWVNNLVITPDEIVERNKDKEHRDTVKEWLSNKRIIGLLGEKYRGIVEAQERGNKQRVSIIDNFYRR